MILVYFKREIQEKVNAIMLFEESSGILVGLYYLSGKSGIESPERAWLIDMTSSNNLTDERNSLAYLLESVCAN